MVDGKYYVSSHTVATIEVVLRGGPPRLMDYKVIKKSIRF